MKTSTLIRMLAISHFAFSAVAQEMNSFTFELRVSKSVTNDPTTSLELTSEASSSGTRLRDTKQREEGEFRVFQHSFLLHTDKRRALVIGTQPAQVFVLSIPQNPKPADWTEWQRPSYTTKGDAGWDFMYDQKKQGRSTSIPADCFQMRYKVEKVKLP